MTIGHSLKSSINGLRANKSRAFLTILGIVIGIAAIILIMSLGQGAQSLILGQIQGLGSKTIVVLPGRQARGPSDAAQTLSDSLKEKDLQALQKKSNVPHLSEIVPLVFGSETIFYEGTTYRPTLLGVSEQAPDIFSLDITDGSFFTEEDVKSNADVVVIGSKVKNELFALSNPIGQKIKIKNRNFKIIGVLPQKGQVSFFNFDDSAFIPYTTAQNYILGIKYFNRFIISADSESTINQTASDITATLRSSHNITDPSKDDFNLQTQADLVKTLGTITTALTIFLTAVAAISLVVGGIGIMNIMLVSVTERTREIGLRKALGATNQNILTQFLIEAVVLTGLGGIIGIIIGTLFSFLASLALKQAVSASWTFSFPFLGTVVGLLVSGAIGLIFGIYPARQAAQKSPMEALRYE